MTDRELVGAFWNEDRTEVAIKVRMADGTRTVTFGWADAQTAADNVDQAIQIALERPLEKVVQLPGQKNNTRRVATRFGDLYLAHMSGPPTWWLPRISLRRGLMVGWLRHAFAISFRRGRDGTRAS